MLIYDLIEPKLQVLKLCLCLSILVSIYYKSLVNQTSALQNFDINLRCTNLTSGFVGMTLEKVMDPSQSSPTFVLRKALKTISFNVFPRFVNLACSTAALLSL